MTHTANVACIITNLAQQILAYLSLSSWNKVQKFFSPGFPWAFLRVLTGERWGSRSLGTQLAVQYAFCPRVLAQWESLQGTHIVKLEKYKLARVRVRLNCQ